MVLIEQTIKTIDKIRTATELEDFVKEKKVNVKNGGLIAVRAFRIDTIEQHKLDVKRAMFPDIDFPDLIEKEFDITSLDVCLIKTTRELKDFVMKYKLNDRSTKYEDGIIIKGIVDGKQIFYKNKILKMLFGENCDDYDTIMNKHENSKSEADKLDDLTIAELKEIIKKRNLHETDSRFQLSKMTSKNKVERTYNLKCILYPDQVHRNPLEENVEVATAAIPTLEMIDDLAKRSLAELKKFIKDYNLNKASRKDGFAIIDLTKASRKDDIIKIKRMFYPDYSEHNSNN